MIDRVDAKRRRREADLRVSEERFRVVTETAVNAIITADQHGNIGLWNKAAETIFGYAPSEILGRPVATLMPERFQAAHKMGMEQAMPVMDGLMTLHALRHLEPDIQVILLTDGADIAIPADIRANVRACLAKPFTNEQLLAAVRQASSKLRAH